MYFAPDHTDTSQYIQYFGLIPNSFWAASAGGGRQGKPMDNPKESELLAQALASSGDAKAKAYTDAGQQMIDDADRHPDRQHRSSCWPPQPTSPACTTARAATWIWACSVSPADQHAWQSSIVRRFILRRLAAMPLLLLGIVTIAFCISRLIPADPLASIVGVRQMDNPTIVAAARAEVGAQRLDRRAVLWPTSRTSSTATSARRSAHASR